MAPRVSADRLENYKAGTKRAGKSKSTTSQRQAQNKGVKDGTIRLGKSGKSYNVYDSKTGTWKRGVVSSKTKAVASRPTTRVSPSARGEGSFRGTPAQTASRALSGYVGRGMGKAGAQSIMRSTGRSTLRGALIAKRREDTRNQNRNAAVIASIPAVALGGGAAAGAIGSIARTGTAAAAGARSGIASGAGLAGRAGTKSPTATRTAAAAKAARTRRANAAKTARSRKK